MSLQFVKTAGPIINYREYTAEAAYPFGAHYNPGLVTPPRHYLESVSSISHFFYEPSNDYLVAYITFTQDPWPGWSTARFCWQAEDGSFVERSGAGIIGMAWTCHAAMGSYNKIYTTWNSGSTIDEIKWDTLGKPEGGWSINPWNWNPQTLFRYAVVNREDNLIAGVGSWNLEVWDISGPPSRRALMRLPYTLGYLTYQSRNILWVITSTGIICKANYKLNPPRWEMMSKVQDPTPDALNYLAAWDPKRARLAVLRQLPDDLDGSCRSRFEFYRPLVKVAGLTDPVPVGRHRAGDKLEFVAHLYGDAGEGITPYKIHASLNAPALGTLLGPETATGRNGAASFFYQAPAAGGGTERLRLDVDIQDGAG
jgi:hypothetical protein